LFALPEDIVFGLDVVVPRFIAFGGRSFRLLFTEDALLPPGRFSEAWLAVVGRFELAVLLAGSTPRPLNTPALALAATAGCPWFTDASCARFVLAACSCCICAVVG
jgi:hypothetical protein